MPDPTDTTSDSDADVRAALASYNDPSKSLNERVGRTPYAQEVIPEDRPTRQLSPQSTDLPPVTPPHLQNLPKPEQYGLGPHQQEESPFKVFFNPMVLLGAASSLLARKPLMGAMAYATGAINGARQGQQDVFDQNKVKFDESLKQAVDQNKLEVDKYRVAWDRREELKKENFAKLYAEMGSAKDVVGQNLARSGLIDELVRHLERKEIAQDHLEQAVQMGIFRDQMMRDRQKELLDYRSGGNRETMIQSNVKGIENGTLPPTTSGLYSLAPAVKAGLAEDKFDLTKAALEYEAAKKQILSLNGPQMTRYVGLAKDVDRTIDRVNELAELMRLSGITALNKLELQAYINTQGNSPNGQLATQYITQVGVLKETFANLANGGYAPTEPAWHLANQQINENYGVDQLGASLQEVKRAINYRLTQIPGLQQFGPGSPNRYEPQSQAPAGGNVGKRVDRAKAKAAHWSDEEIDLYEAGKIDENGRPIGGQ